MRAGRRGGRGARIARGGSSEAEPTPQSGEQRSSRDAQGLPSTSSAFEEVGHQVQSMGVLPGPPTQQRPLPPSASAERSCPRLGRMGPSRRKLSRKLGRQLGPSGATTSSWRARAMLRILQQSLPLLTVMPPPTLCPAMRIRSQACMGRAVVGASLSTGQLHRRAQRLLEMSWQMVRTRPSLRLPASRLTSIRVGPVSARGKDLRKLESPVMMMARVVG